MKKLITTVIIVTVAVFGLTFSYKNPQFVEVNYYFGMHFAGRLPVLLLGVFAGGILLGYCVAVLRRLTTRKKSPPRTAALNYGHGH